MTQPTGDVPVTLMTPEEHVPRQKRGDPPNCPHCDHPLAGHRMLRPVYDRRAEFHCSECACYINGSLEAPR